MKLICGLFFGLFLPALSLTAQTATLRGRITDESGALVLGATVLLTASTGIEKTVNSAGDGTYIFAGLTPGTYTIQANAPSLSTQPVRVTLRAGAPQVLNLQLRIVSVTQQITVQGDAGPTVDTDASSNASSVVLSGDALQALADDAEDLQADLQALAGPSAGPGGGSVFIDGFSGGELPQKDSIREIRINQNPFSPEYDKLGFGRIEVLTKPGSGKLHGNVFHDFTNDVMDSRNPFASRKAPLQNNGFGGSLSGPLNPRLSFTLDAQRSYIYNGSVINAILLSPELLPSPFADAIKTRQQRTRFTPRVDYQLNKSNTVTFRYAFTGSDIRDGGIGGFNLLTRGNHFTSTNQTLQIIETAVVDSAVNETRFQYFRGANQTTPTSMAPAILVLGSFNDGGGQTGHAYTTQNDFELQNYVKMTRGAHTWDFGVRMRGQTESTISPANFGGTFTFTGGPAPQLDAANRQIVGSDGQPTQVQITSIEQYRRTVLFQLLGYAPEQIAALGGGASQFSISAGNPVVARDQVDAGLFVGDDWRILPNFTISLGLRYEIQTNIRDHGDFAPRVAFAWAPGRGKNLRPKTVLRGGFGIFYDRFALSNIITAERYNGVTQQQYVVSNPDFFPGVPTVAALAGLRSTQVIQEVDAHLRAPYLMQSAFTVERQLPKNTTVAFTYNNSHGLHQLRSLDINAPLPGTYNRSLPGSGVFRYGTANPIFLMTSSAIYNQNQMFINVNSRISAGASMFAFYALNYAKANSDGLGTFPANPYDWTGEYGRASTDIRHRFTFGSSLNLRGNFLISPLLTLQSGAPFNITTGSDLYGTTMFNGRPGVASNANAPGVMRTTYGLLDPNPTVGEQILPRNLGQGRGLINLNVRLAKTWGFGSEKGTGRARTSAASPGEVGPPDGGSRSIFGSSSSNRRYDVTLSLTMRNALNHLNPGAITGNIASPLFGQANSLNSGPSGPGVFSENANNRRLEWQLRLAF